MSKSTAVEQSPSSHTTEHYFRDSMTLDFRKLKAAGIDFQNEIDKNGNLVIRFNVGPTGGELFNCEALEDLDKLIGASETEQLVIKARSLFNRGIILALLSK